MPISTYRGYSSVGRDGPKTALHGIELVKRDLLNHFNTRFGERVGRPDFGSIIHDLLFELFDDGTKDLVLADARRVFKNDPRVQELKTEVVTDDEQHLIVVNASLLLIEYNMETNFQAVFGR